ncbi:hypothetical protein PHYPSEUDO_007635 [Phytophthora pseudosyringae]|uniref:Uncharacterized protein n=1 Tax=Phytophthora pseudosyringae TaxID=221518 RepID=A0A8T1VJA6_9STRA|nr:hypothetical protein PHYPSEUDO_007635 [Phytophthora pseudosyringae]
MKTTSDCDDAVVIMAHVNAAFRRRKARGTSPTFRTAPARKRPPTLVPMDTPEAPLPAATSPTLPSARSLFWRSPDVSTDCQRPVPRLHPLPPRSPSVGDKTLLVFVHPDGAAVGLQRIRAMSPRSVAVAGAETQEVEPLGRAVDRKRRSRDSDELRTSSDDGTGGDTPRRRKRSMSTGRDRKPTYLVRKEEKDELTKQVDKLEAQLEYLKHTASLRPECSERAVVRRTDHKFFEQEMHNHLLREAVRNQHFQLFSAQSALSELTYSIQQNQCPINTFIHLGCDIQQRRSVLEGMKAQKLRDAKQLMDKRMQFLRNPAEQRRETSQFPTDSGALCSVVFDVTPLDSGVEVEDVAHAYRAATAYVMRMGTMMPPYAGDDAGVVHGRLQVDTSPELPTESSFVMFSELQVPTFESSQADPSDDNNEKHTSPLGLFVLDSVDEDELHPFRPDEFLREDVNAVLTISRGSRRVHSGGEADKCVPCLVLTRWVLLTLRPDQKGVAPAGAMDYLLQTCIDMGNEMLHAMQEASPSAKAVDSRGGGRKPWSIACSSAASGNATGALNAPS